ncbi:TPA: hypothetical protein ACMU2U_001430 [Clostridioides difficile]|nr:hypothetical protein [Clostridioides difficile]MCI4304786.1 hypothetical protein [Clostridioides difficile]MCM4101590.1 hypothetical protein [Clostridioides difficile]HDF4164020.1 hypothetical protein [Clostridioides difficile]
MNNEMDILLEKIRKVKILADNGVGGEQESAQRILKRLMEKHSISIEDLEVKKVEKYYFRYKDNIEKKILTQVIGIVTNLDYAYKVHRRKEFKVECTIAKKITIDMYFDFYKKAFNKELKSFLYAFFYKNNMLIKGSDEEANESKYDMCKIAYMVEGISEYIPMKMLE